MSFFQVPLHTVFVQDFFSCRKFIDARFSMGLISCRICGAIILKTYPDVKAHITWIHGISLKMYVLKFGLRAVRQTSFEKELSQRFSEEPIPCPDCEEKLRGQLRFKEHRDSVHGPSLSCKVGSMLAGTVASALGLWRCGRCGRATSDEWKERHTAGCSRPSHKRCEMPSYSDFASQALFESGKDAREIKKEEVEEEDACSGEVEVEVLSGSEFEDEDDIGSDIDIKEEDLVADLNSEVATPDKLFTAAADDSDDSGLKVGTKEEEEDECLTADGSHGMSEEAREEVKEEEDILEDLEEENILKDLEEEEDVEEKEAKEEGENAGFLFSGVESKLQLIEHDEPECITLDDTSDEEEDGGAGGSAQGPAGFAGASNFRAGGGDGSKQVPFDNKGGCPGDPGQVFACPECGGDSAHFVSLADVSEHIWKVHF